VNLWRGFAETLVELDLRIEELDGWATCRDDIDELIRLERLRDDLQQALAERRLPRDLRERLRDRELGPRMSPSSLDPRD
jgi:hypothetical protein